MTARRTAGLLGTGALVMAAGTGAAEACQACFGAADSPLIDGAKLGAWMLIGVTVAVQGSFVAFFLYLRRRARSAVGTVIDAEWTELQRGTRRS